MPNRKVSLPQYRPSASDFVTNLDSIPSAINAQRRSEPAICGRMRDYLSLKLSLFGARLAAEVKRFAAASLTSQATQTVRNDAINDARTAATTAIDAYAAKGRELLASINGNCTAMDSSVPLSTISKEIEDLRATQLQLSSQLAAIPAAYEEKIESLYKPVEEIIGST